MASLEVIAKGRQILSGCRYCEVGCPWSGWSNTMHDLGEDKNGIPLVGLCERKQLGLANGEEVDWKHITAQQVVSEILNEDGYVDTLHLGC